jgi:hypothetical protein
MTVSFSKTLRLPAEASAQAGYVLESRRNCGTCGRALIFEKILPDLKEAGYSAKNAI